MPLGRYLCYASDDRVKANGSNGNDAQFYREHRLRPEMLMSAENGGGKKLPQGILILKAQDQRG